MSWLSRVFFAVVAAFAIGGLVSGIGCTRRGSNNPAPPTPTPQTNFYVNPSLKTSQSGCGPGSDSAGNGTLAKPYRTIGQAVSVIAKKTATGLTLQLCNGVFSARSGEKFPIVIPTGMTIAGSNYGAGFLKGSYVNGYGVDGDLQKATGASPRTYYATLEVGPGVTSVNLNGVYVGSGRLALSPGQKYAALVVLGGLNATHASFYTATRSRLADGGVIVASGSLTCTGCHLGGTHYAIEAFSLNGGSAPAITLGGQLSQDIVEGQIGLLTDGTASISAANQAFVSTTSAYDDSFLAPAGPTPTPSTSPSPSPSASASPTSSPSPSAAPSSTPSIDFGSQSGSIGQNNFYYVQAVPSPGVTEIRVTRQSMFISALGNTWNANKQGAGPNGLYTKTKIFFPGAHGENVTVATPVPGTPTSHVVAGPIKIVPTPSPSPSPSGSPSASPSPTASPTG